MQRFLTPANLFPQRESLRSIYVRKSGRIEPKAASFWHNRRLRGGASCSERVAARSSLPGWSAAKSGTLVAADDLRKDQADGGSVLGGLRRIALRSSGLLKIAAHELVNVYLSPSSKPPLSSPVLSHEGPLSRSDPSADRARVGRTGAPRNGRQAGGQGGAPGGAAPYVTGRAR
jgi:hypothetical protein